MKDTIVALFSSRKWWTGIVTIAGIATALILRSFDKIPQDAFIPTLTAVTSTGLVIIGSIAWEDAAAKGAGGKDAPPPSPASETAVTMNVGTPEPPPTKPGGLS